MYPECTYRKKCFQFFYSACEKTDCDREPTIELIRNTFKNKSGYWKLFFSFEDQGWVYYIYLVCCLRQFPKTIVFSLGYGMDTSYRDQQMCLLLVGHGAASSQDHFMLNYMTIMSILKTIFSTGSFTN